MLPQVIFLAGKKRAGKTTLADILTERCGYTQMHIATAWIKRHLNDMGVSWEEYQADKPRYREEIQRRATLARAENPNCLVDELPAVIEPFVAKGGCLVVDGVRFSNEALFAFQHGYLVVKVKTPDFVRRERFIAAGENLAHLNDPFEREIDLLPFHISLPGTLGRDEYLPLLGRAYAELQLEVV